MLFLKCKKCWKTIYVPSDFALPGEVWVANLAKLVPRLRAARMRFNAVELDQDLRG